MPWNYPATLWTLDPSDSEGWLRHSGELIYCDGMIGKVKDQNGTIWEAPLHCVYIQVPATWFLTALSVRQPTSGTYGSDFAKLPTRNILSRSPRTTTEDRRKSGEEEIFG